MPKDKTTAHSLKELVRELEPLLLSIKLHCVKHKETIAVAESVTSGLLQFLFSTTAGAMDFYQGGVTTYNTAQKTRHLDIEPINAEKCNAVSQKIVEAMAHNVCRMFCCEIGIGITGYANQVPEEGIDKIFAYAAIVRNGKIIYSGTIKPTVKDMDAQFAYASAVIRHLSVKLK